MLTDTLYTSEGEFLGLYEYEPDTDGDGCDCGRSSCPQCRAGDPSEYDEPDDFFPEPQEPDFGFPEDSICDGYDEF